MSWDDLTFRRICQQLERELHRELTPDEMTALRLAESATPRPVTIERRQAGLDAKPGPGPSAD